MLEDVIRNLVFVCVLAMAPLSLYAAFRLVFLSRKYGGAALTERATVSVILAMASFAGAALSLARLTGTQVPPVLSVALNGTAAILIGVPAIWWLYKYRTDGFNDIPTE